ncbi:hypothetical protein ATANTOWER_018089 [Ataeniobius toweri]|uniref:Uncharacterized protein n=1 Tax=Ataeniobius toweri TaxID=208326 RepID=A0ABU7AYH0_9TELE|nr:hypothetical protein [Ataeniobius toweri]
MAKSTSNAASTASGLFQHFSRGKTVLGLTLASAVVGELECLNISLQKKTQTVSGMQAAVNHVRSSLKGKRNDKSYLALYETATTLVDSTESIDPIQVTHSSRFVGKAEDHYRAEFFKVLDSVEVQFCQRFDQVLQESWTLEADRCSLSGHQPRCYKKDCQHFRLFCPRWYYTQLSSNLVFSSDCQS